MVVDHATIQLWVVKFTPMIDMNFRKRKRAAGNRWNLDETYLKVKGKWCDLTRAVDKQGIRIVNKRSSTRIKWRQCKYLNNIVEQDHRFIKWRTKNMLGFK